MPQHDRSGWPVLTRYDQDHLLAIALPLGGIGTGTVSIGGRGELRDWEIVNRPAKGFSPQHSFFALHVQRSDGSTVARALEGVLRPPYDGSHGSIVPNHNLPRFRNCSFATAYPFGQVLLADPDVPLDVRLETFNPLIPGDTDRSSIPAAILRFVLGNPTNETIVASVCGSVQNFIGSDGKLGEAKGNANSFRTGGASSQAQGIFMHSEQVDPVAEQWGTMALVTTATTGVTYRTAWPRLSWGDMLLDFWDDWSIDGTLEERSGEGVDAPVGSLAAQVEIPPGETRTLTFLLTWHFPNRQTWTPAPAEQVAGCCEDGACWPGASERIGNYYTTRYQDAWDAAVQTVDALPQLEADTLTFVNSFCDSDLPLVVREAALYNLSTLRSQTCFRTEDGYFFGWEGCHDTAGCCHGSCTHVWNYEHATGFLFGDLARSMREVEFMHTTDDDGLMSFRVNLPLARAKDWKLAAADGQMGCLMRLYREWQLSGDDEMLRLIWPKARKALEFCWIAGGWDADRDGVMEGCQHNTMDVEYYGPNPQMGIWYLGALRACEEMARYLGEQEFAQTCSRLFERGRDWIDTNLFNGEYYEHQIWPPASEEAIAPGLRHESMGSRDLVDPHLQLGAGCLVDQLVGQYTAHVCGLGYLVDQRHVETTLRSLMKYNYKDTLFGHFNHLRTFALNDEAALLMATYPRGRRPARPFPYFNEVMTGFEYAAAVHMLYEGQVNEGLKCIGSIRARYDGLRRNPFDEAECGHHYARAMASWAAVLALTGFHYSGVTQTLTFGGVDATSHVFWSNGSAWGTCKRTPTDGTMAVELKVLHGSLDLRRLAIDGTGMLELEQPLRLNAGDLKVFEVRAP